MNFDAYRKPLPVTYNIEGESFEVELPTRWNKPYMRAWQEELATHAQVAENGTVSLGGVHPHMLQDAQRRAFVEHCIIRTPVGKQELLDEYVMLLDCLYETSTKLADELEEKAEALVGKLSHGSNGAANGKDNTVSTKISNAKVASPAPI